MAEETNTVRLSYKNYEFEVTVDFETFTKINSDEIYKEDFARQTYESLENDGHFIGDQDDKEIELDIKPVNNSFRWTKPAIDYLIQLRFSKNEEFNSPRTRKSELWHSLGLELNQLFPGVTGEMCDAKYRNLLHTYKLNKQKESRLGSDSVKWEYFTQFDANLGLQLKIPHKDMECYDTLTVSELDDQTGFCKADLIAFDSPPASPSSVSNMPKKNIRDMRLTQYLRLRVENDHRNLKLKARIWKEKKQLKEREIAAILQLAKALKSKK